MTSEFKCPKCGNVLRIDEIDRSKTLFETGLTHSVFCKTCNRSWETDSPEKYHDA
jgi:transcription elongation factor Elf1